MQTKQSGPVSFTLDGALVTAAPDETIWQVAKRLGTSIPHLCHSDKPGYRADGNCRACMVEVEGERVLAASCLRKPVEGMKVSSQSQRADRARKLVVELLLTDTNSHHNTDSEFKVLAEQLSVTASRFPGAGGESRNADSSHAAIGVHHDACIHCNLCVRACDEVQVNGVIAMGNRGGVSQIIFDQFDEMGSSTCVGCGECVQACPTGALMPSRLLESEATGPSSETEKSVNSVCPFCGVGCQLEYRVKDEQILYAEGRQGPANEGRLCVKGRFGFDYIHHPHRLTKPLIRLPNLPKGLNVDPANPLTHFREASWQEALEVAAQGLNRLKSLYGGQSVSGLGSAKCSNEEAYLFQKLIRQGFGHNNVDHCTRLCHASSVAALMENIGSGAVTATFNEIENADVAILIGCNPTENHPVAATFFKQFARRGGKLIVMDPRGTAMKRFASHMLQFSPGADVALLNAMMHVIVEENLQDQHYIDKHTENWMAQKQHLQRFSPEAMAPLCGIAPAQIRDAARTFARGKAGMIFWGMGVSQHVHGTDNARCLISLALMCGHVGRPGTGLHPLRGQNNVQGASDAGLIPMFLPDYQSVAEEHAREAAESLWGDGVKLSADKGLTVVEMMDAIHSDGIRGMVIMGENPAMSDPDVAHARAALARLDHLVVQDIFLTETACFADVILPAAAFPEKTGTVTNTNRQVQMGRKAVESPGEAKEDWLILTELADHLGLNWQYGSVEAVFTEMKRLMPSLDNISWQRLEFEDAVTYPCHGEELPGESVVFADSFPRCGGKARFSPADLVPPDEVPDKEFPYIMTTGRQLEHWHTGSMTRRSRVLDAIEPTANCSLNPTTLKTLGINAGENIKLVSRRGEIVMQARADNGVAENMVFVPFAYVEAAANLLTNSALDPYGKIPEFKFAAVRLEVA
ncbi:formate dehydrogenase subunit alpha [Shewanella corallii]|uniref:Formate dehydrogenase subunit alpha n=1 Tax=Shewanella corallii TaxID=560080 RepID=A0ABT0N6X6_9GAMM|nr:formate dehydrogenase subunit alpha [Shewanella corallii]MCL2914214.1 formate dehydrogenase subunit alpha [Shewanella corallii]